MMRLPTDARPDAAPTPAGLLSFIPPALVEWPQLADQAAHDVAILFIDVAGFTRLSELLLARGPEGAEVLDRSIAAWFDGLMEIVVAQGGRALKISGDALTILFYPGPGGLGEAAARATACAARLARYEGPELDIPTRLAHKVGVGAGRLYTRMVGDDRRQELIYGGPALDGAVTAEHCARAGEVWLAAACARLLPGALIAADAPAIQLHPGAPLPACDAPPPAADGDRAAAYRPWLRVIPPAVLEHAARGSLDFLCRHQTISALFVGCAGLGLDSEGALSAIADHYRAMAEVVESHGGFLSEFEAGDKGSKLIVMFGAPAVLEDPATQAARCARAMQERARDMGLVGQQRIGMASGRLYVGRVGCRSIVKYSALGDRMNLAARLMAAAEPWEVLAEGQTALRTLSQVMWGAPRVIAVKGKAEPVSVQPLVGLRSATRKSRRGEGLVGRGDELGRLKSLLVDLDRGHGAIVDVVGAAGVGKSRLAGALWREASDLHDIPCHAWRGLTVERRSAPLAPWASLLAHLLGMVPSLAPAELTERFTQWQEALPPERRDRADLLAPLLGVTPSTDPPHQLDAERRLILQREALADALLGAGSDGIPRLFLVEEADRLDAASWQLIEDLAPMLGALPILVCLLRRPPEGAAEPFKTLGGADRYQRLDLGPLGRADAHALACRRLGADALDGELATLLEARTQGNPLLIEAWADTLRDAGRVQIADGAAYLTGDAALELPDRFEALVLARLERLPLEAQTTLRVASVIEIAFTPAEVAEIHTGEPTEDEVRRHLALGADLGILHYDRERGPRMYFSRREVRDALHNTLPFQLRRQIHGARVAWLLRHAHGEVEDETALLLAAHHRYSSDRAAQLTWFSRAMDLCHERFEHREAISWAQAAIAAAEALGDQAARLSCLKRLQHAQLLLGESGAMVATIDALYEAGEAMDRPDVMVEALTMRGRAHQRTGDREQALAVLRQARELAHGRRAPELVALALTNTATVLTEAGRLKDGLDFAQEALRQLPAEALSLRAAVLANLGFSLSGLGRSSEAYPVLLEALTVTQAAGQPRDQATLEGNVGIELWGMGRPEEGHARLLKSLELKRRVGDRREQAMSLLNVGFSHLRLGLPDQAREDTEEAYRIFRRLGYVRGQQYCLVNLAENELLCERIDRCEGRIAEARAALQRSPNPGLSLELQLHEGELALHRGDGHAAQPLFEAARRIAVEQGARVAEARAVEGLGTARLYQGDALGALGILRQAVAISDALSERPAFPQRLLWRAAQAAEATGEHLARARWAARALKALEEELDRLTDPATRARVSQAFAWNREILRCEALAA